MSAGTTDGFPTRLDDALADTIGPEAAATVRRSLCDRTAAGITVGPHGTVVFRAAIADGPRRRVIELDRWGEPLTALRWTPDGLIAAWARIPDGSWLVIEPRAAVEAPWGAADRVSQSESIGTVGRVLTVFEALDWNRIDRIPTLAVPAALPPGGGSVVLNLIAELAADQHRSGLRYRGPYPTEQLFLSLLESFRYETAADDPLAAFMRGELVWKPAPHEQALTPEGAWVQLRGRIEKVVWRGRTYHRPDWQGIVRHAPTRVLDAEDGVRCSLWALGGALEDHLVLTSEGAMVRVLEPPKQPEHVRPLPAIVSAGIGAVVAAGSAAPLGPFIREAATALTLEWAPLTGQLADIGTVRGRISTGFHARLVGLLRAEETPASRAMVALAALTEIALLLGDTLRARAQARLADLSEPAQRLLLESPPPASHLTDARLLTDATEALLLESMH